MRDGLYKATYEVPGSEGEGLLVMSGGRIWGGDRTHIYTGTYKLDGDFLAATVKTSRHAVVPGIDPLFGQDVVTIILGGRLSGSAGVLIGSAVEVLGVRCIVRLKKLTD